VITAAAISSRLAGPLGHLACAGTSTTQCLILLTRSGAAACNPDNSHCRLLCCCLKCGTLLDMRGRHSSDKAAAQGQRCQQLLHLWLGMVLVHVGACMRTYVARQRVSMNSGRGLSVRCSFCRLHGDHGCMLASAGACCCMLSITVRCTWVLCHNWQLSSAYRVESSSWGASTECQGWNMALAQFTWAHAQPTVPQ
jgi:hypothetical protein